MKNLGEITVGEVMSIDPITISRFDRMTDAVRTMEENRVSALPVVDELGKLAGILSTTDLISLTREIQSDLSALWFADESTADFILGTLKDQNGQTQVGEVMTTPVTAVRANDNLIVVARQMRKMAIHHFPVVDHKNVPVGMLSTTDFVRLFAETGALFAG